LLGGILKLVMLLIELSTKTQSGNENSLKDFSGNFLLSLTTI